MNTLRLGIFISAVTLSIGAAQAQSPLDDWAGTWIASEEQEIVITAAKKAIEIEGFATWGATDPERVERGGVNVGEFSVRVPRSWIENDRLIFLVGDDGEAEEVGMVSDDDGCIIEMMLGDGELMVGDSGRCGGMNVTFNGVYKLQ